MKRRGQRLRRWVLGLTALGVVGLSAMGVASWVSVTHLREEAELVGHTHRVDRQITLMVSLVDHGTIAVRGYLASGDPRFLAAYDSARTRVPDLLDELATLMVDTGQRRRLGELRPLVLAELAELGALARAPRRGGARALPEVDTLGLVVRDRMTGIQEARARLLLLRQVRTAATTHRVRNLIAGILIAAVVGSLLTARLVLRLIDAREGARLDREQLFEFMPDLLIMANQDGTIREVNPAWKTHLGYEPSELVGRPFLEFVHPDDRTATSGEFSRVAAGGARTLYFENRYRSKEGAYRWLAWTGTPVMADGVAFGAARDITALKAAEAEVLRLRGLLPICASCHKIRDDQGGWIPVERYIEARSAAAFTHSICPDCSKRLYGE